MCLTHIISALEVSFCVVCCSGNKPCDLKIDGADKHLKGLTGGLDGKYEVHSCENGRPLYKRENSPKNEERLLWYSSEYRDWDLTNGTMPRDVSMQSATGVWFVRSSLPALIVYLTVML